MNSSYWKNKTIMVSGGLGFIGSHFVEELALAHANVICLYRTSGSSGLPVYANQKNIQYIQNNLLDRQELEEICKNIAPKIDCFIHCAALDGNTEFKLKYAAQILDTNSRLVSNVLNCCRSTQIKDVVLLSSAEIYSPDTPGEILETDDYHKYLGYANLLASPNQCIRPQG
jgi:dTDP-4-dehydro-6-deoxy-alpha-D-gulose 4-ketoreductase